MTKYLVAYIFLKHWVNKVIMQQTKPKLQCLIGKIKEIVLLFYLLKEINI